MSPKLGILAGGGQLPKLVVRACRDSGREFLVIAFEEQAARDAFADVPHARVRLGAAGQTIRYLREAGFARISIEWRKKMWAILVAEK